MISILVTLVIGILAGWVASLTINLITRRSVR